MSGKTIMVLKLIEQIIIGQSTDEPDKQAHLNDAVNELEKLLREDSLAVAAIHEQLAAVAQNNTGGIGERYEEVITLLKSLKDEYGTLENRTRLIIEALLKPNEKASVAPEVTREPLKFDESTGSSTNNKVTKLVSAAQQKFTAAAAVTDGEIENMARGIYSDFSPIMVVDKIERFDAKLVSIEKWSVQRKGYDVKAILNEKEAKDWSSFFRAQEEGKPFQSLFSSKFKSTLQSYLQEEATQKLSEKEIDSFPLLKAEKGRGLAMRQPAYSMKKYSHVTRCVTCDAAGYVQCKNCGGTHHITCRNCNARGKNDCRKCDGTGSTKCRNCNGNKKVRCPVCTGNYRKNCPDCNATGADHTGLLRCKTCHGNKKVSCASCEQGLVKCGTILNSKGCNGTGQQECRNCFGEKQKTCVVCNGTTSVVCKECFGDPSDTKRFGKRRCTSCKEKGYFARHSYAKTEVHPSFHRRALLDSSGVTPATKDKIIKSFDARKHMAIAKSELPGERLNAHNGTSSNLAARVSSAHFARGKLVLEYFDYLAVPIVKITCRNVFNKNTFTIYLTNYQDSKRQRQILVGQPWAHVPPQKPRNTGRKVVDRLRGKYPVAEDQFKEKLLLLYAAGAKDDISADDRSVILGPPEEINYLSESQQKVLFTHVKNVREMEIPETKDMLKFSTESTTARVLKNMKRIIGPQLAVPDEANLSEIVRKLDTHYINRNNGLL